MDSMRVLAVKILEADRVGGTDAQKIERLVNSLTPDDGAILAGRWIAENGRILFWDDNLLDLAERLMDLPTKPLDPNSAAMREYEQRVAEAINGAHAN